MVPARSWVSGFEVSPIKAASRSRLTGGGMDDVERERRFTAVAVGVSEL
jgi:hypothetical protein